ncbi:MAG: N-acetylneuraminate synthase family protein [Nitrospinaceae bacterium]
METEHTMEFCGKPLGPGHPPFVVAEVGFNHLGDVKLARRMVEAAAENLADAVKLQTFVGEELVSKRHMAEDPEHPGREIPLYEFFRRYELTRKEYEELFEHARQLGIPLFSTPFDETSLNMLVELNVPAVKIASPDLTHLPLLRCTARTGLPVVISSGMAESAEIEQALKTIRGEGNGRIILLHCVSHYPSRHEEMNLRCLPRLRSDFSVPVGLSDHTLDQVSAMVAAALGAVMIEKHFTIDRKLPGADNAISMEPDDLRALKTAVTEVTQILGDDRKRIQPSEEPVRKSARRSIVARVDIEPGTVLTEEMLAVKRPGTGISPEFLDRLIGKPAKRKILAEQVILWDMV